MLTFAKFYLYHPPTGSSPREARQESLARAMQRVAVCCSVLQCVAVCCSVQQCAAVKLCAIQYRQSTMRSIRNHWQMRCSVLQSEAECCSVLQCVAVKLLVMQCVGNLLQGPTGRTGTHSQKSDFLYRNYRNTPTFENPYQCKTVCDGRSC